MSYLKSVRKLVLPVLLSTMALFAVGLILLVNGVLAQGGGIYVDKQLGRANPTVFVGEYLTFTIYIRNDTAFTVTTLPLFDTFNSGVLGFVDAVPSPDNVDQSAGHIDWADLTTFFGDVAPGQDLTVVVGFIAEHPETAVVNAAEVHDAINENGDVLGGGDTSGGADAVGGSAPVSKTLATGVVPQVGELITFNIVITNTGYVTLTRATLVDTYDPNLLAFYYANPYPDQMDVAAGVLTWTNVVAVIGGLPPRSAMTVTTVFTALSAAATANHAQIVGAGDWYDNDVDGGGDDVPITIIDRPTPTPLPTPTAAPRPTSPPQSSTPAPTAAPTPTPDIPPSIALLPMTGHTGAVAGVGILFGLVALGIGIGLLFHTPIKSKTIKRS